MHAFVARLRDSERAWTAAVLLGFLLVLASGSSVATLRLEPAALAPILVTAALGALLALWVARAAGSRRRGLAIALAALFTTPLLPYAFDGFESVQALLLLAAAFCAIGPTRLRYPARDAGMLLAAAGVLAVDAAGALLAPLLLWLAWCSAERSGVERRADPKPLFYGTATLLLALLALRALLFDRHAIDLVTSPVGWLVNLHTVLLSLNYGLVFFAPLVLLGLWRAFRGAVGDRRTGQLALFAAASLIAPYAAIRQWSTVSDSSWGPRHLLAAFAPALLALALSRTERARRGGHRRWIIAAVLFGLAVNTLGTALPREALAAHPGLALAGTERAEVALQFDPAWNHARVNAALLGDWLQNTFAPAARGASTEATASSPRAEVDPAAATLDASATTSSATPANVVLPSPILLRVFDPAERAALLPIALLCALIGTLGWALLVLARHAAEG